MGALLLLLPGIAPAVTRDVSELQPSTLTFRRSVLNQVSYGTYRVPFDELQTRPYNLIFTNIGRHSTISPWQGQEGAYRRYVDALIGNNGASNVDNDADSLQGSLIQRQSDAIAWGLSVAFLAGTSGSDDLTGSTTFTEADDLSGVDLRGSAAFQLSERNVLGVGVRVNQASSELSESNFEPGVGGSFLSDTFDQLGASLDAGLRHFINSRSSWEVRLVAGYGMFEQTALSEALDDTGIVTSRFVVNDYDVGQQSVGISAGYNKLRRDGRGETQFRAGLARSQRELDNTDLSFVDVSGTVAPLVTLLAQDPIVTSRLDLSARSVFQAGHTEMFVGAQLGYGMTSGFTQVDAGGFVEDEEIDDTGGNLGLVLGLRQPVFRGKLRFFVSGRADLLTGETKTTFSTSVDGDDFSQTVAQYAVGIEGVLANVTFDLAWLAGQEQPPVSVPIGIPEGSRRIVELNRLVVSAAVSW